jgi:chemotaxis protein histidine kinase CheA
MTAERLELADLEGVYPLLDLLQVGFVLIGPTGDVRHVSALARRMLGRRLDGRAIERTLVDSYDELIRKVLDGDTWTTRWRDHHLTSPMGDTLDLSIRSVAVEHPDGQRSALMCFYDVSVEVALHRRYKDLLSRQEAINEELRRRIAEVLREHEDDHAQFSELLQIAPAIFASFVAEADAAVRAVARVADAESFDDAIVVVALREGHTLKGNARGLGLNFIAGRAHAVEELLASGRKRGQIDRAELAAGVADLRRAIDRAVNLRGGLEAGTAGAPGDAGALRAAALAEIADTLTEANAALGDGFDALRERLERAVNSIERMARVPLTQLLHYLRATARTAAAAAGATEPAIDVRIDDVAVPGWIHQALQTALPHLVRNAVVHGLEPTADRVAAGKPAAGVITVEARQVEERLIVRVDDDGRGIDRARLLSALAATGASGDALDRASLADLVFHPGLSSRDGADLDSGRGMGALAARDAIASVGGTLEVTTRPGAGTTFTATVPLSGPRARRPTARPR